MNTIKIVLIIGCCMFVLLIQSAAQDTSRLYDQMLSMPDKMFMAVDRKAAAIDAKLARQTDRYLNKLGKREQQLKDLVMKKDSALAQQMFGDVNKRYSQLKSMSGKVDKYAEVYSGQLDSLRTGLKFLQGSNKVSGLADNAGLQKSLSQLNGLQDRFNQTDQIRKYLSQREGQLKEQLGKLGMLKEIRKFRKDVYYYQSQVKEYKTMFEDPDKIQKKVMALVRQAPQFRGFFNRNSQLAGLFALPGGSDEGGTPALAPGIQTNASVTQGLQERFGSNTTVVRDGLQQAGGSSKQGDPLSMLKDKVSSYSSGSLGNDKGSGKEVPDFKPNNQKTKSFLSRLEVGTNLQSQKARSFFPVTTDLGLSVGYKLNDRSVIGVGMAYKMGLGSGWNKIRVTHQGLGMRSYVDYKIKGAVYVTGGYEQNYRSGFRTIVQLKDYSGWQSGGLLGLSKRYAVGRKAKGEMKVLWDFLSYQQIPKSQPILFRLGYNLK